jgi:anti-sigma regulatory factor (Ser/Thr protein kinase)
VRPGDTVVLYTDGLIERRNSTIDAGLEALRRSARSSPTDLEPMCDHIIATLLDALPADDVALLAIRPISLAERELRLHRPASPAAVPEARRIIRSWLRDNSVSHDDTFDVLVATTEAYANAVQHAYGIGAGSVDIVAWISGAELHVAVTDRGTWRPTSASANGGGRGLALMRALMDDVEIESGADGTEVRMRRDLKLS